MIAGSWAVFNYRLDQTEKRIEKIATELHDVHLTQAKDDAKFEAVIQGLDKEIEGIWPQLEILQKEFYKHED